MLDVKVLTLQTNGMLPRVFIGNPQGNPPPPFTCIKGQWLLADACGVRRFHCSRLTSVFISVAISVFNKLAMFTNIQLVIFLFSMAVPTTARSIARSKSPIAPGRNEILNANGTKFCESGKSEVVFSKADLADLVPVRNCTYPPARGGRNRKSCRIKESVEDDVKYYCMSDDPDSYVKLYQTDAEVTCTCRICPDTCKPRYPSSHCFMKAKKAEMKQVFLLSFWRKKKHLWCHERWWPLKIICYGVGTFPIGCKQNLWHCSSSESAYFSALLSYFDLLYVYLITMFLVFWDLSLNDCVILS